MAGEHGDGPECWCSPTVVPVPGRTSVVYAHHDTLHDAAAQAERAARVFQGIAEVASEPD